MCFISLVFPCPFFSLHHISIQSLPDFTPPPLSRSKIPPWKELLQEESLSCFLQLCYLFFFSSLFLKTTSRCSPVLTVALDIISLPIATISPSCTLVRDIPSSATRHHDSTYSPPSLKTAGQSSITLLTLPELLLESPVRASLRVRTIILRLR